MAASLTQKLQIKPGQRALVLNSPEGFVDKLQPLPGGVSVSETPEGKFDFVHLFAQDSSELNIYAPAALEALAQGGTFWISYPKGSSGVETDLTRDKGWEIITRRGLGGVRQISVDGVWSAVRFSPSKTGGSLIEAQYAGRKAALRPIYESILEAVQHFGSDVELAPRKTYVGLVRAKIFGLVKPSTNTRLDVGIKLKGAAATSRLTEAPGFGSGSVTHKVSLTSLEEVDKELIAWLRQAYERV